MRGFPELLGTVRIMNRTELSFMLEAADFTSRCWDNFFFSSSNVPLKESKNVSVSHFSYV